MNNFIKIISLFVLCCLLSSCVKTETIERIGIVNAQGVDLTEEELLELTLIVFQFSAQSDSITKIIHGKGKTLEGSVEDAEHASMYPLVPGKLKLMLFGEEIAKKGILPLLDAKSRDARVPDLMYLSVGRPNSKEILTIDESKLSVDIGQFLHDVIENHSTDHNVPRKTLQDFLRIYYDVGQDNVLPIFEIKEDIPKQTGVALFKGDKVVGELNNQEVVLINLMERNVKEQLFELALPLKPFESYLEKREEPLKKDEVDIVLYIKKGKSKTRLVNLENLKFETNTKMQIRLIEQSAGIKLSEHKVVHLLEKEIAKKMEERFEKLLTKLKEHESDPFGYGRYYKSSRAGSDLTEKEWREKYQHIDVNFNVEVELINHGVND